ncbi:MAG: hypothetical protein WCJ58_06555 [bacterium]
MKYLEIRSKLNNLPIFATKDIQVIDHNFNLNNLINWMDKGYIVPLRKNYYIFSDQISVHNLHFMIANCIYYPSYISLESAFAYYHLIPESVYTTTSISTRKTNEFNNPYGRFTFRTIKPELFWGYKLIRNKSGNFLIADPEKSLLDFLYLNSHLSQTQDFFELRFNFPEFLSIATKEKLDKYLEFFNNNSLSIRVANFLKFYHNAQS